MYALATRTNSEEERNIRVSIASILATSRCKKRDCEFFIGYLTHEKYVLNVEINIKRTI